MTIPMGEHSQGTQLQPGGPSLSVLEATGWCPCRASGRPSGAPTVCPHSHTSVQPRLAFPVDLLMQRD